MRLLFLCNSFNKSRYCRLGPLTRLLPEALIETVLIDRPMQVSGPLPWRIRQGAQDILPHTFDLVIYWPISFQERRARFNSASHAGKEYIERSWGVYEQALLYSLPPTLQLNPIANAVAAANKVIALDLAIRNGILIPDSLVGNDVAALRAFMARQPAIIKLLTDTNRLDRTLQFFPRRATAAVTDGALEVLPQLLQAEVSASKELRSYYICGEVQAFETERDATHCEVDVRLQYPGELPWRPCAHPEVEALTHRLAEIFGLRFFSADFLRRPNDELLFLDINPHTSWHWLSREAIRIMDAAFARALRNRPGR